MEDVLHNKVPMNGSMEMISTSNLSQDGNTGMVSDNIKQIFVNLKERSLSLPCR